jgi:hypothetical protein
MMLFIFNVFIPNVSCFILLCINSISLVTMIVTFVRSSFDPCGDNASTDEGH